MKDFFFLSSTIRMVVGLGLRRIAAGREPLEDRSLRPGKAPELAIGGILCFG